MNKFVEECVICYEQMYMKNGEFINCYKKNSSQLNWDHYTACCKQPIHHNCFKKSRSVTDKHSCPMCRMTLKQSLSLLRKKHGCTE